MSTIHFGNARFEYGEDWIGDQPAITVTERHRNDNGDTTDVATITLTEEAILQFAEHLKPRRRS